MKKVAQKKGSGKTEKRVFLIAADYVPNDCDALKKAQTIEHANMTASSNIGYGVCSSYWADVSSVKYHCNDKHNVLNSNQPQCSFPEVFMTTGQFCDIDHHYYCSDHVGDGTGGNINSRCASSLQCTGNWKSFVKGDYANYAIGGPTLEMWVASWNQKHGEGAEEGGKTLYADGKGKDNNNSGYYVGDLSASGGTNYDVSSTLGFSDTLYFPHKQTFQNLDLFNLDDSTEDTAEEDTGTNENASCYGYWLSSPSAAGNDYLTQVNITGVVINNKYNATVIGVRPVISLKSDVKLTKTVGTGGKVVYKLSV